MSCDLQIQELCVYINQDLNANQVVLGFDITGATIEMQFRKSLSSAIAFKWSTTDSTIVVTNAATGTFVRTLRKMSYPVGVYYADCLVTLPGSNLQPLYRMKLTINDTYAK